MSKQIMSDKLDMASPDLVSKNIEQISALFPNCVTETANGKAIDFDLLKQELSRDIVEGNKERYRLEWPGKKEAIVTANLPTTKTLRPVREDSVDFDDTENLYIEGDNLEVLKLLQESYLGKIKMIYIDPPYNTGKDFVYKDNYTQETEDFKEENGLMDEYKRKLITNPETSGRYHSDWLTMMYPRLKLARNLLSDNGIICISIDDNEQNNLQKLCTEIFGENNFVGQLAILNNPKGRVLDKYIANCHEYLLIYSKNILPPNSLSIDKENNEIDKDYPLKDDQGRYRELELRNTHREFGKHNRPNLYYPFYISVSGEVSLKSSAEASLVYPDWEDGFEGCWTWGKEKSENEIDDLVAKKIKGSWKVYRKAYADRDGEAPQRKLKSIWTEKEFHTEKGQAVFNNLFETKDKIFQSPKSVDFIMTLIEMTVKNNDTVLDFFSGSATTGHALMKLNAKDGQKRKFILVQIPEETDEKSEAYKLGYKNICAIGKARISKAGTEISRELPVSNQTELNKTNSKLDTGFRVFRIDASNMKDIFYRPQDYNQGNLELFADNVKEERTADDLLTQIMLDWGLPLSLGIERLKISDKEVFKVAYNSLMACFDKDLDETFAQELATHQPLRVVFRDKSFKNDTAKENVRQLLKQLSPDTEMRVL